jgi:hypothetical protein
MEARARHKENQYTESIRLLSCLLFIFLSALRDNRLLDFLHTNKSTL